MSNSCIELSIKEKFPEWFAKNRIKSSAPQYIKQIYFIEKAKKLHGGKYDYSRLVYEADSANVKIICTIHGEFEQLANTHVNRSGCSKCSREALTKKLKSSWPEVHARFKNKHGDKFDYSKVLYTNNSTKVIIICPEHGEFEQAPSKHIASNGCTKCPRPTKKIGRLTTDIFITRSREKHGDKYDYSKSVYKTSKNKVIIICSEHGEFKQTPSLHFNGSGCSKCVGTYSHTTEECIINFQRIHGNKYDYSKVIYNGNKKYVTIICFEHGEFEQKPNGHLMGDSCPKCGDSRGGKVQRLGREGFIERAQAYHGDRYDYSKVIYGENVKDKVVIICSKHGEFKQSGSDHLQGHGCQICARIGHVGYHTPDNVPKERWYDANGVYVLLLTNVEGEQWIKVGITKDISGRVKQIIRLSKYTVDILSYQALPFVNAWNLEQDIHKKLSEYHELPCTEFSGHTECFTMEALDSLAELNMITYAQMDCVDNGYPVRNWEIENI